jgi:hypothetical protein
MTAPPGKPTTAAERERNTHERFLARQAKEQKAEAAKERRLQQINDALERNPRRNRPQILLRTEPEQIEAITDALNLGHLPNLYVCDGQVVVVETPTATIRNDGAPIKRLCIVNGNRLRNLLANHTYTYRRVTKTVERERIDIEEEASPTLELCRDVLSTNEWPRLRPLHGIVSVPFFRPDGELVQTPGYDDVTGLLLDPVLNIDPVPDNPTVEQLRAAKTFLVDDLLGNFPWVDNASKANYIAGLFAPITRTYLGGALVPMLAVDAKSQGTGKTLLCTIIIKLYSGYTRTWISDEAELRKAITSILLDEGGSAVLLDNVNKGETVDSGTLAAMLTMRTWSDRILGRNDSGASVRVPNNRVWMTTGNSLVIGGDNKSRSMLVQLDAKMPNPENRPTAGFRLGNLEDWLEDPEHRATAMWHLLVLARGWIRAGAPRVETPMRTFTPWASASAGLLGWLKVPGFGTNAKAMADVDPQENLWATFYAHWFKNYKRQRVSAGTLVASVTPDMNGRTTQDWEDSFVRTKTGRLPIASHLGQMLRPEIGVWHGDYVLAAEQNSHSKTWVFWLEDRPAVDVAVDRAVDAVDR